jgi:hypothetical protein
LQEQNSERNLEQQELVLGPWLVSGAEKLALDEVPIHYKKYVNL